jgi:tRNA(fMet)-specific endonuclease VapC
VILDTNALSAFVDGEPSVAERLLTEQIAAIPVIVLGEFRYGLAGSRHRAAYEEWLDENLREFEVLAVTETTAITYAGIRVSLRKRGHPIPANDCWIAALAIEHRLSVLSRDAHFDAVPGLRRVAW